SYVQTLRGGPDAVLKLLPPDDPDEPATITIRPLNATSGTQQVVLTTADFWQLAASTTTGHALEQTFVVQPSGTGGVVLPPPPPTPTPTPTAVPTATPTPTPRPAHP